MKHSFCKNQETILLVLGMTLCTLSSCNQSKVSQGQTNAEEDTCAVEDAVCADNSIANSCPVDSDTATPSPSASSSSSTEASGSLAETAYHAGYYNGTVLGSPWSKRIKEIYVDKCMNERLNLKKEYASNRSMYKEFRRGFLKACKEHEDAKNAL